MKPQQMSKVSEVYKGGFFKNRHKLSWRAPIVGEALIKTFDLLIGNSIVDVGCAIGDYVLWLDENGFTAWGIEGSEAAEEFMLTDQYSIWDLRFPLNMGSGERKYDLAFSLEVAEHIEPFYVDEYIKNLITLSDTILISAASPGQKGHGHVNCASKDYWVQKFANFGFDRMPGFENRWKESLALFRNKKELSSYYKNVICFRRYGI